MRRLAENLLLPGQVLAAVRYFTARISPRPGSTSQSKRQATFLEALETRADLHIHYGHYLAKERHCPECRAEWTTHEEKMTDVNIAVELLGDAQDDAFDTAIIISGDSDLTPPVRATLDRYPEKRVIIAFPPARHSSQLADAATAAFTIGRKKLKDSQLPDEVVQTRRVRPTSPNSVELRSHGDVVSLAKSSLKSPCRSTRLTLRRRVCAIVVAFILYVKLSG